ncbi:MAG: N5-carboxyaminoimidazole ribonucleotide mutase [Gracilibacter sp. BRH_c7a]|nr:MAG: N5-carboxyaminoimidazole ribonucleotide mutase [Gracilibacter sp. BRH_c7a]
MSTVGVIMGSDSDYIIMDEGVKVLQQFEVSYKIKLTSTDNNILERTVEWLEEFENFGGKVIIAGNAKDLHFAGKIAGLTTVPVIAVPIRHNGSEDIDSLFNIVQQGSPVAAVGINGARNAALLAVAVLGINDEGLRVALKDFRHKMTSEVMEKDKILQEKSIK